MNSDKAAGATWFKSSHSNPEYNCVEVAFLGDGEIALRDSKNATAGPVMVFASAEWTAFIGATATGDFDHPTA